MGPPSPCKAYCSWSGSHHTLMGPGVHAKPIVSDFIEPRFDLRENNKKQWSWSLEKPPSSLSYQLTLKLTTWVGPSGQLSWPGLTCDQVSTLIPVQTVLPQILVLHVSGFYVKPLWVKCMGSIPTCLGWVKCVGSNPKPFWVGQMC